MKDETTRMMEAIVDRFKEEAIPIGYGVIVAFDVKTDFPTIVGDMEKLTAKDGDKLFLESRCEIAGKISPHIYVVYRESGVPNMVIDDFSKTEIFERLKKPKNVPKFDQRSSFLGQSPYDVEEERGFNFIGRR